MKIAELELAIGKYIKNEVAPNIPNTLERFMLYTGSALVLGKGERLLEKHLPLMKKMDIINDEGDIDVELLYQAAKHGIKATGTVQIKSMVFNEGDLDKLYEFIKGGKQ